MNLLKLTHNSVRKIFLLSIFGFLCNSYASETIWLDTLDLSKMRQGWGKPQVNRSIREKQLSIGNEKFDRGVGTHGKSIFWLDLGGETERFIASVGVDDAAGGPGSVVFKISGDGKNCGIPV
jgi:hypothetical protein